MNQMKVFISHTSEDKTVTEDLGNRLLKNGLDAWLDTWETFPGDSLHDRIERGMDEVDAFLILISLACLESTRVRDELKIALDRRRRDPGFRVVPMLLQQVRPPGYLVDLIYVNWSEQTAFESILRALQKLDPAPGGAAAARSRV